MDDLSGKQFGSYEIGEPLGEGGMAAVYKAYQPSMNRFVAIKVLPRKMAKSAEFTTRFKREAHLLAQLQHPHILPIFDYGQADEYTYIVMPLMQSGTLSDLLKTRRVSLSEIRNIISQVGDALGYAHARGMIHRDIKPSNVLMDERGNCLLTDFGLARMTEATSKLTSSGAIMGTPAYMSPEQGSSPNVDGRSDLYSLGVMLYEMVTGQVPYSADTPLAIVFKHILEPLPPPRELVPDISPALEQVIAKVLAKKPEERYQSAEEFVKALQRAIPLTATGSIPAPLPPESQGTRESMPPPRRPAAPATMVSMPRQPRPTPVRSYQQPARSLPPASQPPARSAASISQPPAQPRRWLSWALGGVGVLAACGVGVMLLAIGIYFFGNGSPLVASPTSTREVTATSAATAQATPESTLELTPAPVTAEPSPTPTQAPTATLPDPPTVVVPLGSKFVRINVITVNDQKRYVVDYETFEFTETLPGTHVHFFFNTVSVANAGAPGLGPWKLYGGPRPFTDYGTSNRPTNASELCVLVANSDHSVIADSGNCFPLPDVPTVTARVDTVCLKTPTEVGETVATFKAGTSSLLKGFSSDKNWFLIENPVAVDGTTCWIPISSSLQGGDSSSVPVVNP